MKQLGSTSDKLTLIKLTGSLTIWRCVIACYVSILPANPQVWSPQLDRSCGGGHCSLSPPTTGNLRSAAWNKMYRRANMLDGQTCLLPLTHSLTHQRLLASLITQLANVHQLPKCCTNGRKLAQFAVDLNTDREEKCFKSSSNVFHTIYNTDNNKWKEIKGVSQLHTGTLALLAA